MKIIIGLVGVVLIALAVVVLTPSPAPAQPVIAWVPESVNETVLAGETKTVSVSFTASEDLEAVDVRVVPELEPFVRTEPTSFASIPVGQEMNLNIIISAAADASPQTVEGTIQIRNAGRPPRNYARPLPVTVEIREGQRVTNEEGGYSLIIPLDWQSGTRSDDSRSTVLIPPNSSPDPSLEYIGDIVVDVFPNSLNLGLDKFYETAAVVNLFSASQTQTPLQINGLEAILFEGVFGMSPSTIAAVAIPGRVVEITDVDNLHQEDNIFNTILTSIISLP